MEKIEIEPGAPVDEIVVLARKINEIVSWINSQKKQ